MSANFAIPPDGRPAPASRPRCCAPAARSVTRGLVKGRKFGESCIRTGAYPANPAVILTHARFRLIEHR